MRFKFLPLVLLAVAVTFGAVSPVQAAGGGTEAEHVALLFFWIAAILLLAKLASLVERFGQPAVLGELVIGIILGNLTLVGLDWFEPIATDEIMLFLAELGVVILLFQVGLEIDVTEMRRVGVRAAMVAIVGVIVPFSLGTYIAGPLLLPGLSANSYLFLGATLTATSVGITARVFSDLGRLQSPEARIVLGAAVIDDVLGLIILAVVSAIVISGTVSVVEVGWIIIKAVTFLVGAVMLGQLLAPRIGKLFSSINAGVGMKFTLAFSSALILAYLAQVIGLAPIIGAFTAALILDPVHFRGFNDPAIVKHLRETLGETHPEVKERVEEVLEAHSNHHIEELLQPISFFLVPIFFVMTGMAVRLETLFDPSILLVALGITVVAFISKIVAGWVAGKGVRKAVIGWGMAPRGEVGLIFASIGQSLGVVSNQVFSVIVMMVVLTTLLTPPILTFLLKRSDPQQGLSISEK